MFGNSVWHLCSQIYVLLQYRNLQLLAMLWAFLSHRNLIKLNLEVLRKLKN